ncbi:MAG: hypothetical protein JRJ78_16930, partial [Deltaproteobacteria bacterium]|nr:hypothetical protein [Deltaproteobacteria bacterium]
MPELPSCVDSERYVLGACILDAGARARATKSLAPGDFYSRKHALIWEALQSAPVGDPLAVTEAVDKLSGKGKIKAEYIFDLAQVKEMAKRRRIIRACHEAMAHATDAASEVDGVLSGLRSSIQAIEAQTTGEDWLPPSSLVNEVYRDIERRRAEGKTNPGILTGLGNIDHHMGGLEPETTVYIIARPSVGKTALALTMADHIADHEPGHALFFALESNAKALTRRRLSARSAIWLSRIRSGNIEDGQWSRLIKTCDAISSSRLIIIDKPKYKKIENLQAISEAIHFEMPVSCIFVDHIIRMSSLKRHQSQHLELGYISEMLTSLAKDLKVPVVILCQLNRAVEARSNRRPMLSDMRECLVGGTMLIDAISGCPVTLGDVKPGQVILAYNQKEMRVTMAEVRRKWWRGQKPTLRVVTQTGREIIGTTNHPVLTERG